jgi:hypothetical protein
MIQKIIIDPGFLPALELQQLLERYVSEYDVRLVYAKPANVYRWSKNNLPSQSISYSEIESIKQDNSKCLSEKYIDSLMLALNDYRTLLHCERCLDLEYGRSVFLQLRKFEKLFFGAWQYLSEHKPDFLLFLASPHHPRSWAMGKVAECLNIPVLIVEFSPVPWRYRVTLGMDERAPIVIRGSKEKDGSEFRSKEAKIFVSKKNQDYNSAIPHYEKVRLETRKGKYWSWKKEILSHKYRVIKLFRKKMLFNAYYNYVNFEFGQTDRYVAFFLHFQPEVTTLPDGMNFADQWFAIRTLSMALPLGYKLVIKEHPSIFTFQTDLRYRHKSFYKDMASLPNVLLAPFEADTFKLIDEAVAVSTITGTVGVEALARGTPVIFFGKAVYRDAPGAYSVSNVNQISEALDTILRIHNKEKQVGRMEEYIKEIIDNSISGLPLGDVEFDGDIDVEVRPLGHLRLIQAILDNVISGQLQKQIV